MLAGNGSGCCTVGPLSSMKCFEQTYVFHVMSVRYLKSVLLHMVIQRKAVEHSTQLPVLCLLFFETDFPSNSFITSVLYELHDFGKGMKYVLSSCNILIQNEFRNFKAINKQCTIMHFFNKL